MSDLDSHLRRQIAESKAAELDSAKSAAQLVASKLAEEAKHLDALSKNPDVAWFFETHVKPLVDAEHERALSVLRSTAECDAARQRHDIARTILELLPKLAAQALSRAQEAYRNIPE